MKPILIVCSFIGWCSVLSCNNKVIALQQTYLEEAYRFSVPATKGEVWAKLIDVLTAKGLAIATIDEHSGLITTANTSFFTSYSFENKDGSLTNPDAFVVCTKVRGPFTFTLSLKPESVSGQWTVITKQAENQTLVNIKLANAAGKVVVEDSGIYGQAVTRETHHLVVKSTGIFEKSIEKALVIN